MTNHEFALLWADIGRNFTNSRLLDEHRFEQIMLHRNADDCARALARIKHAQRPLNETTLREALDVVDPPCPHCQGHGERGDNVDDQGLCRCPAGDKLRRNIAPTSDVTRGYDRLSPSKRERLIGLENLQRIRGRLSPEAEHVLADLHAHNHTHTHHLPAGSSR